VLEFAGYRVLDVLGSGGNGTVFRARHPKGGHAVALKVIPGPVRDGHARRRFTRGAELANRLQHPNIVRIIDAGETSDGGLYLAMDLLEGEDLDTRLGRGPLEIDEAISLARRAALALEAAHAAGVLHRDVKPGNVFLCADGDVKVLDFGVALLFGDGESTRMTGPRSIVGTPGYMAVEQARGTRDEDIRTDVWGLGATLYHSVAGRPPFDAPTSLAQLVRAVTDEPDRMPARVPSWLQVVILRCLRKSMDERWPTMRALRDALDRGSERRSSTPAPPPAVGAALGDEVRVVSVLVADHLAATDAFERAVRAEGGIGPLLLAGGAVGVFGGESWRGDEAEHAVRAGLAVRERDLSCRLGVATGRAVRAGGGITGTAVANAQQVLAATGVGADTETLKRIRGAFDVDGARVLRRRHGLTVLEVRGVDAIEVPMVGREREISDLSITLGQIIEEKQAAGVLLVGAPGIGKSRLVHALQLHIEELPVLLYDLEGRGESHRRLQGWHAIGNALRLRVEIPEGTPRDEARAKLLAICPSRTCAEFLGEILRADFPETPALLAARSDPGVMHDQILVALGDFFEALAARHPVVLVVEDLQWADAPSLGALEVLLRRLERRPFFVVGTARPEFEGLLPDFRRVTLAGISRAAIRRLVEAVLGGARETGARSSPSADARIKDATALVYERSGGNPFFAEELAMALREGVTDLPASVEAATQARLDALPPGEKELLRRAAVLGRRFWTEALEALGVEHPLEQLTHLRRRELVAPEPRPRLAGATEWRFRHAIVQEVAYGSLTPEQQSVLHRKAGEWLAQRRDAPPLEVARHLEADGDPEAAAPFWQRAADAAYREGDARQVLSASANALRQLEGPEVLRHCGEAFRLRSMRADVLSALGQADDESAEIDSMELVASTAAERAEVHERRGVLLRRRGRYEEAASVLERGLLLDPAHLSLLVEYATTRAVAGDLREGLEVSTHAVAAARRDGDVLLGARAVMAEAYVHELRGDVGTSMARLRTALAVLEPLGQPALIATARGHFGYCLLHLGRHVEAAKALAEVVSFARAVGNRRSEGYARRDLGLALARCGDVGAGLSEIAAAHALADEVGDPRLGMHCARVRATVLFEADRLDEARRAIDEALAAHEPMQGTFRASMLGLRAAIAIALGRVDAARRDVDRALELRRSAGGMQELETELYGAAHAAGVVGALDEGVAALLDRAGRIPDETARRSFLEQVPANARLLGLAAATTV
jgi:tetratricopeptide (TPR) repeat protein